MTKSSRNLLIIIASISVVVVAIFAYIYVQNQKQKEQATDIFTKAIQVAPTLDNPSQAIKDSTK